jgi:hypothetical protein
MVVSQVTRSRFLPSYRYTDIGHASIAKSKVFYTLPELNNGANGFVPGYELLEG